jgi:hypothetical protein
MTCRLSPDGGVKRPLWGPGHDFGMLALATYLKRPHGVLGRTFKRPLHGASVRGSNDGGPLCFMTLQRARLALSA